MSKIKNDAIKCLQDEAQALLDLIPQLTNDFEKAIQLIFHCRGKLIITGVGKSGHIGAKIAATLASTGTPSFFVNPLDAFHGDLGMITSDDVVLAISNSGQTDELLRFIPFLIEKNIPLIGMSGNPESLLAQCSSCHLNIAVKREACPLNLAPTSSTTATLALGDAIACALINLRNFQVKDFAKYHPGGNLGKKLLTQVKDVMYKEYLPIITADILVCDAIIEISRSRLGIAIAIENEEIQGIITDGDVRRAMIEKKDTFFDLTVKEVMTTTPQIIVETANLLEATSIMQVYKIHTLVVVNENKKLVGLIDNFNCI